MGTDVEFVDYKEIMRVAVDDIKSGGSFPKRLWMEDEHTVVCSLPFDMSIFVYNSMLKEWYVFNENGHRGYICFVFSGTHYDVLISPSSTLGPPVPKNAKIQGPSHSDTDWIEVPVGFEKYSFAIVWKWPKPRSQVVKRTEMNQSSAFEPCENSKKTDLLPTLFEPGVFVKKNIATKSSNHSFQMYSWGL